MSNADVKLSIIVPVLNEAGGLLNFLKPLQPFRDGRCEIILVDGGSDDNTLSLADPYVDHLILSASGRARQMNAGSKVAVGQYLLFLHADTLVDLDSLLSVLDQKSPRWGFFKIRLSGQHYLLRWVECMMNWRSQLSSVATGDQGIFVKRQVFIGSLFPDLPLMEDVAFSKRMRKLSKPQVVRSPVVTSSRRWEANGIVKTIALMWGLRLAYFCGVSVHYLHDLYYTGGKSG